MRLWRLSGALFANRFDGGYGIEHAGRWNERGRLVTYCATGPALCVLEKLVHVEDIDLLPDDTMLVRYDVPDHLQVEESQPTCRTVGVPIRGLPGRSAALGWMAPRPACCESRRSSYRSRTPMTATF